MSVDSASVELLSFAGKDLMVLFSFLQDIASSSTKAARPDLIIVFTGEAFKNY